MWLLPPSPGPTQVRTTPGIAIRALIEANGSTMVEVAL